MKRKRNKRESKKNCARFHIIMRSNICMIRQQLLFSVQVTVPTNLVVSKYFDFFQSQMETMALKNQFSVLFLIIMSSTWMSEAGWSEF